MRRRLYFLLPTVAHCKALVTDLRAQGVSNNQIHVVARDDIELEGLHQANALQKTELAHGLEWGVGLGGIAGLLGGLLAVTFPPAGILLAGEAILLGTTLAGAGFGAVVSALVAGDIPNHELDNFQDKIALGEILLLLDISTSHVAMVIDLIKSHHPEAEIGILNANVT
jgi:hypothetical protein